MYEKHKKILWTPRLRSIITELSERGLSDPAISVVLDLYENFDVSYMAVRNFRHRCKIEKACSSAHRKTVGNFKQNSI